MPDEIFLVPTVFVARLLPCLTGWLAEAVAAAVAAAVARLVFAISEGLVQF